MRTKIYDHKTNPEHPHLGLKATHGGLLDNEFLAQTLQLKLGYRYPELRNQNTQNTLNAALRLKILSQKDLLDNLDCFKKLLKIECALRQDTHTPQTQIPTDRAAQQKLARWIGLPPEQNFLDFYRKTLETNAETTQRLRQALKT
jgi:glutamine synthetase adenylyltransferase